MKRQLRRSLLTVALALVSATLWAEEAQPCVVVEQTDGTRTEYLLTAEPRVSYDGAVVRLVSSEASVELAVADVAKVYSPALALRQEPVPLSPCPTLVPHWSRMALAFSPQWKLV